MLALIIRPCCCSLAALVGLNVLLLLRSSCLSECVLILMFHSKSDIKVSSFLLHFQATSSLNVTKLMSRAYVVCQWDCKKAQSLKKNSIDQSIPVLQNKWCSGCVAQASHFWVLCCDNAKGFLDSSSDSFRQAFLFSDPFNHNPIDSDSL